MKVELISHTPDALDLLLTTKGTRLSSDDNPADWSEEKKAEHLDYMLKTIKSSWEFVDYVFRVSGVTRNFTHQLVRTRTGSFAQQSQRVVDARDFDIVKPDMIADTGIQEEEWDAAADGIKAVYADMVDMGVPIQDARGILPTNISTDIIVKFNLRTMHETAKTRMCTRTQGEYQDVFRAMRDLVIAVHPWAAKFINVHCVAEGACAFPNYGPKECPVYFPALDVIEMNKAEAEKRFWLNRYVAAPIAEGGKT